MFEAGAVPAAEDVERDGELVSAHGGGGDAVGVDVDYLDGPVAVGAAGGGNRRRAELGRGALMDKSFCFFFSKRRAFFFEKKKQKTFIHFVFREVSVRWWNAKEHSTLRC